MRKILLIIALIFILPLKSQGLNFLSDEEYNSIDKISLESFGFSDNISSSYTFERYVPTVLEQTGGTCVGFATLYYGLSTMYNVEFNITETNAKAVHAFDPYFIYTLINNKRQSSDSCDLGLNMSEATETLMNIGAKKIFFPPFLSCNSKWDKEEIVSTLDYTLPYSLETFYVADMTNPNIVDIVKGLLYNNIPIISGFSITESLYPKSSYYPNGVDSNGLWSPSELEDSIGGHAMTLVGYDDYKYGGAFRVVNSWGRDYGDNGFIWVKYSDWKTYAEQSYVLELNENLNDTRPNVNLIDDDYIRFTGDFGYHEGQTKNDKLTGYGITYERTSNTHFIARFYDSEIDGFTIYADDDGWFTANVVNGEFYDITEFGFGGDEKVSGLNNSLKSYLLNLGFENKIRQSNSTKKLPTSIER